MYLRRHMTMWQLWASGTSGTLIVSTTWAHSTLYDSCLSDKPYSFVCIVCRRGNGPISDRVYMSSRAISPRPCSGSFFGISVRLLLHTSVLSHMHPLHAWVGHAN
jgi:hypothetical protein